MVVDAVTPRFEEVVQVRHARHVGVHDRIVLCCMVEPTGDLEPDVPFAREGSGWGLWAEPEAPDDECDQEDDMTSSVGVHVVVIAPYGRRP